MKIRVRKVIRAVREVVLVKEEGFEKKVFEVYLIIVIVV